jgi:CheY-like chemotaxis protein
MIAVTAHKVKGIEAECYEKGFDDFLAKPFTMKSLKVVLDRHFRSLDQ